MNDKIIQSNKFKEDGTNLAELVEENKDISKTIDASIFDKTLKEIDRILNSLEQKSESKDEVTNKESNLIENDGLFEKIENLEENISDSSELNALSNNSGKEIIIDNKEHRIDKSLMSLQELHTFEENVKIKEKSYFGFYTYLVLTIFIFFTFYVALNFSKDLIILKYPIFEPYINYFYEIIEILEVLFFGIFGFIKNIVSI
tara:strand:- start:60 stop:665 length:606 start_codon:yes stop_codon:yes gene_type:complete